MKFVYLDSCAAIKLFKDEVESDALEDWLVEQVPARQITSYLTRTELPRGLHAVEASAQTHERALHWLRRCAHVALPASLCERAGSLSPGTRLRSLDAIHIAAAQNLGAALVAFVSYDKRLIAAASEHGLPVVSPS
ncbi:type II toxin-antitoxin system VapC family toxin [Haloechinothrix salitolerans]|uniref:Ribonuclease VapC n=1 Tax=Haloechinothrix salitolerans TaxID=926830 RepID=A0ABW2BYE4_9PSEU